MLRRPANTHHDTNPAWACGSAGRPPTRTSRGDVACPECGAEMHDSELDGAVLPAHEPPSPYCTGCGEPTGRPWLLRCEQCVLDSLDARRRIRHARERLEGVGVASVDARVCALMADPDPEVEGAW